MSLSLFVRHPHRIFGVAVLAAALPAPGQETAPVRLTLDQALARALERNPALAAQRYGERAAAALVEQAGARPNPQLEMGFENFAGTGRVQGVRSLETTVQASQTFERGGKREKRVVVANRGRDAAAGEFAVRRAEVLAAVAGAYLETVAAQQRLALSEEPLALARETVEAVNARVRAGAASAAGAARARAALAGAQVEFARAQAGLVAARATLAATWGGTPAEVPTVAGTLRVPAAVPDEGAFADRLAQNPRLEWQRAQVAQRRAALELEQAQAVQDVTVGGGLRLLREGSDAGLVAGVTMPLPVRNRNQGNIRAARENLAGAEQAGRAVESELRSAFTAAWQNLVAAHAAAQSLRRDALPAAAEAHAAVRAAYERGALPLIDVLDAQRALAVVRREIFETESAYAAALVRIVALTDANFAFLVTLLQQPQADFPLTP